MNSKNQRTLLICAAVIMGGTVFSLVALNFIVDGISQIEPPTVAKMVKKKPPTAVDDGTTKDVLPSGHNKFGLGANPLGSGMPPDMMPPPMRNGKNGPDPRKMPKAPSDNIQAKPPMGQPARDGMPAYPPMPPNMDPKEREMFEQEMQRRKEMFDRAREEGMPPMHAPGFYPPPGYEDYGYGEDYDYEEDYDYDYDIESKNDIQADAMALTQAHENINEEEDFDVLEDDYLAEEND